MTGPVRYDAAIAGAGAVGATLACALADAGAQILLADPFGAPTPEPAAFAPRPLAVSLTSRHVLAALGVWEALAPRATPITSIHVSEAGRFGATRLTADACGVMNFGSVVAADALGAALRDAVVQRPGIHRVSGRIAGPSTNDDGITARVTTHPAEASYAFAASLLVVADGGRSQLRDALGIRTTVRDYRQRAIAAMVRVHHPYPGRAFERFTPDGPIALLPMGGACYGLIWSCRDTQAARLAELPERAFIAALDAVFGGRLGGIASVSVRTGFGLRLVRTNTLVAEHTVLVGDVANHLHPVAGQGLNLGLRDAACLAEIIAMARRQGDTLGDARILECYQRQRTPDHARVVRFTDGLIDLFCHHHALTAPLRAPALIALDLIPPLKRALARRAMGLTGKVPKLALGLSL